VVLSREV
jgi:hypothetical protein